MTSFTEEKPYIEGFSRGSGDISRCETYKVCFLPLRAMYSADINPMEDSSRRIK